jgi:hypothetical protein
VLVAKTAKGLRLLRVCAPGLSLIGCAALREIAQGPEAARRRLPAGAGQHSPDGEPDAHAVGAGPGDTPSAMLQQQTARGL